MRCGKTNRRNLKWSMNGRPRRGFALVLTLLALSLISIIGFGLVTLSTVQSQTINNQLQTKKAYNYARSGRIMAIGQLKSNYAWCTSTPYEYKVAPTGAGNITEGYRVSVVADSGNSSTANKRWTVTSTGYYQGATRKLTAWMDMETFALYALFFDDGESSGFTNQDKMDGRVHTNRRFKLYGCPQFSGKATSSNVQKDSSGTVLWTDPDYSPAYNRYTMSGSNYTDDLSKYYWRTAKTDGNYGYNTYYFRALNSSPDFCFSGAQPCIPLPVYNNSTLYGSTTPKYFDYIEDKCNGYVFDTNVYLTFHNNGTVDIKNSSGSYITTNKNGETITNPADTSNLTIKVTGDVYMGYPRDGIAEKMKGRTTVVAAKKSDGTKGNFNIIDSVEYNNMNDDVLGLVAENNFQVQTSNSTIGNLRIDASIMALNGSLTVKDCTSGSRRGDLIINGGLVYKYISGTENASCTTGYGTRWAYDPKLYLKPPVNWPLTGKVRAISIRDHGSLK